MRWFRSLRSRSLPSDRGATEPVAPRAGLDEARATQVLARLDDVPWDELTHAYGSAADVPAQLRAVTVGGAEARRSAWYELWGNIHHQGSVYAATLPAVAVLVELAAWAEHPDRAEALLLLREVAHSDDARVWREDRDGVVRDEERSARLTQALRDAVEARADDLVGDWASAPVEVWRAQLYLLSALPQARSRHPELLSRLPAEHRDAWARETAHDYPETDDDADARQELEGWCTNAIYEARAMRRIAERPADDPPGRGC